MEKKTDTWEVEAEEADIGEFRTSVQNLTTLVCRLAQDKNRVYSTHPLLRWVRYKQQHPTPDEEPAQAQIYDALMSYEGELEQEKEILKSDHVGHECDAQYSRRGAVKSFAVVATGATLGTLAGGMSYLQKTDKFNKPGRGGVVPPLEGETEKNTAVASLLFILSAISGGFATYNISELFSKGLGISMNKALDTIQKSVNAKGVATNVPSDFEERGMKHADLYSLEGPEMRGL